MTQMLLLGSAMADLAMGDVERVALAVGASEGERGRRSPVPWDLVPLFDQASEAARAALGPDAFESGRGQGATWDRARIAEFLATSG